MADWRRFLISAPDNHSSVDRPDTGVTGRKPKGKKVSGYGRGRTPRSEDDGPNRRLAGLGGLGLVMFFLARKKIEFAITPDLSALGDIWVAVGKSKFGVEVKTSRG